MNITLKAIEELKLSKTETKIIEVLGENDKVTLRYIGENINVIYVTLCNELKKLSTKNIITISGSLVSLTSFGKTLINYNKFKNKVLQDFCEMNNIDKDTYEKFIVNKDYNNMKLLLGIKNLINSEKDI